jgi:hypothetical protein
MGCPEGGTDNWSGYKTFQKQVDISETQSKLFDIEIFIPYQTNCFGFERSPTVLEGYAVQQKQIEAIFGLTP